MKISSFLAMRLLFLFIALFLLLIPSTNAQVPDLPEYDPVAYYGYENGASGIADVFLKVIKAGVFDENASDIIFSSVLRAMESIWEQRSEIDDKKVATWSKGPSYHADYIYPGVKYGTAGIVPVFLNMYDSTADGIWLDRAKESYDELFRQAIGTDELPKWSYAYSYPKEELGLSLTGIKYGNMGMLKLAIKMYQYTSNSTYLMQASRIMDYQLSISKEVDIGFDTYNMIPWYHHPDALVNPIHTGYNMGTAGMADVILEYSEVANLPEMEELAFHMADFLVDAQKSDSSWNIEYEYEGSSANFDEGVAGVIYGLYSINQKYQNNDVEKAILKGIDWLFDLFVSNSTHTIFLNYEDSPDIISGLYSGNLGIVNTLFQLYEFLDEDQKYNLGAAINWILGEGIFVSNVGSHDLSYLKQAGGQFMDLSYGTGNAGMIDVILNFLNGPEELIILYDLEEALIELISGVMYYQRNDDLWSRHIDIPDEWILGSMTTIGIVDDPYTSTSETPIKYYPLIIIILVVVNKRIYYKFHNYS